MSTFNHFSLRILIVKRKVKKFNATIWNLWLVWLWQFLQASFCRVLLFSQLHQDPPSKSSFLSLHKIISLSATPSNPFLSFCSSKFFLRSISCWRVWSYNLFQNLMSCLYIIWKWDQKTASILQYRKLEYDSYDKG